jgi:acetylornithine/succinyldiaminopimelate/putrescine aminotransferase/predicted amino acid dehydrogenase
MAILNEDNSITLPSPSPSHVSSKYERYCRPAVATILRAIHMDIVFHKAEGDTLYFHTNDGAEGSVIDFLGGYGASLLGHNHPRIVGKAVALLRDKAPFNAQMSIRGNAAKLAERLDLKLFAITNQHFVTTLANTGTEAVEAAIKHAHLAYYARVEQALARLEDAIEAISRTLGGSEQQTVVVRCDALEANNPSAISAPTGAIKLGALKKWLSTRESELRSRRPITLAQRGSFHGKTTGSLALTENPAYRAPFGLSSEHVVFLNRNDEDEIGAVFEQAIYTIPIPSLTANHEITLSPLPICTVAACFVEPIQGEGGINPLTESYLRKCRAITSQYDVPLVVDEIQCGMGRTGSFLCSTQLGIAPDYLLLSKSLGGGLVKISALMIERKQYVEEFGLLHTSTFAEDDMSCAIALEVLDVLEHDNLAERAKTMGQRLLSSLSDLVTDFPDVLHEVSGKGLMLGLKFRSQVESTSSSIRLLAKEELLGYIISGYLFHLHRIRVAPSLSNGRVIRIEPSAYVGEADCAKLIDGLRDVCNVLRKQQSHLLLQYIVGRHEANVSCHHKDYRTTTCHIPSPTTAKKKIGFVGHFIDHRDMKLWDPALENFTAAEQAAFLDQVFEILSPSIVDELDIHSPNGDTVRLIFVGVCATSEHFSSAVQSKNMGLLRGKVQQAVDMLAELGCEIVGLGAYTSIITNNCEALHSRGMALTSGNSLTVGMGLQALKEATEALGIPWSDARLSVIGATGNIASTYCELAAESVASINMIGRSDAALKRLRRLANRIYADALRALISQGVSSTNGIAARLANSELFRIAHSRPNDLDAIDWFGLADEILGPRAPLSVSSDMSSVSTSDAILCASNAPSPILFSRHLGPQPTAICDISVPPDIHSSIHLERSDDVIVVNGGNVQIGTHPNFRLNGCSLPQGQVFACLAETILLGLTGIGDHYTYGRVVTRNVRKAMDLARFHGFVLSAKRSPSLAAADEYQQCAEISSMDMLGRIGIAAPELASTSTV